MMVDNWRRKGNQEFGRTKSSYHKRKPPAGGNSNGQHNISSWEKRFVTSAIPWKQFLEAKKYAYLYNSILNWDDSAAEEAFKTAKDAFYANLQGIPCDVKSHDPDIYNNKIDWNSQENNDLIRDFESQPVDQDIDSNHEPVVIFGDALPDPYKNYAPYGWGDADDKVKGSWGDADDKVKGFWEEADDKVKGSWGEADDKVKGSWGVGEDMNKGDGNGIKWEEYIKDGKIIRNDTDAGCKNNDWWDWNNDKAGDQGWKDTDNKAGDQGWKDTDNKAGDQGWNYNVNLVGYEGWNETNNKAVDGGWNCNDDKAVDQGWNYNVNKAGYEGWSETDNKAVDGGWNCNDNKAGDQGWNNYGYDYNNYYPSYGNNNKSYYPSYGNGNNERYETCNFIGHNSQRSHTWKSYGNNRSKSSGQGYGRQRAHGSTMQAHGGQRIYVNH